ncbi:MAG: TatD family hydrolase [Oscillospiraceae bacterium]|jgi:TatD DNase family protein|nr:TatD family hydrolase [Oscillospiraceae bacterium]
MTGIFDSHAHYTDHRFSDDLGTVLDSLPAQGVHAVLCCGSDLADSRAALRLADQRPWIFAACGVHPHEAAMASEADYAALRELLRAERCVAVGEIGLDYHYDFSPRAVQFDVFRRQLALAAEAALPVVVHDREAHEDTLRLLREFRPQGGAPWGVVHCFSGSLEMAKELLALGLLLGFGGAVTFRNARKPLAVAAEIPLDRLLLETDAPYMTPEPFRGRRCDSGHIRWTAEKIAEARGMEAQELADATRQNAHHLFRIPE